MKKVDRTNWESGPWDEETDKDQFFYKDYPCLIIRNHGGALCGYVGVSPNHPYHELGYGDLDNIDVHGGLTYAGKEVGQDNWEATSFGEKVRTTLGGKGYWFGFDCAHGFDVVPRYVSEGYPSYDDQVYKDMVYVRKQIRKLVNQFREV